MDRSAEEQRISTTRYASSSSDTSTRLITTLVVKELTWEYSGSLRAETIKACAGAAIRDLRGSISPEALPEMAVRLAKVRLAERPPTSIRQARQRQLGKAPRFHRLGRASVRGLLVARRTQARSIARRASRQ